MAGNLAKIAFAAASTPTLLPTSQHTDKAWTSFFATTAAVASAACASRSTQATAAPASPKASAIARPIPLPAPVTTADFPASEYLSGNIIGSSMKWPESQHGRGKPPERADLV